MYVLPTIELDEGDRAFLWVLTLSGAGVFSCNWKGQVWAKVTAGLTPETRRTYLNLDLLDKVVTAVLRARPFGGRFRVTREGVILASNQTMVAGFRTRTEPTDA